MFGYILKIVSQCNEELKMRHQLCFLLFLLLKTFRINEEQAKKNPINTNLIIPIPIIASMFEEIVAHITILCIETLVGKYIVMLQLHWIRMCVCE